MLDQYWLFKKFKKSATKIDSNKDAYDIDVNLHYRLDLSKEIDKKDKDKKNKEKKNKEKSRLSSWLCRSFKVKLDPIVEKDVKIITEKNINIVDTE